mmetsp:Transcript_46806/g.74884  ORF Transcript_46806/g.74884 Transcript_46806/m.74884 type:complete len:162 (-) Transcript_46806:139-624(-)|eukprot:CAMPEP_0197023568 /NCGR_PEP_ID=MMETSP1384-20130603/4238_1 /TAXON_ID=29189 /ORGANISM="Ammonia sp." /LENGTH=161 /DNA_ID=CAMNT_0042451797 /DNA_START=112 /DNA_END=597 /DNA_ORIENTATION=-
MTDHLQKEHAFQKQHNVFQGYKDLRGARKKKKFPTKRYWKRIGLGFKTPKEAIEGEYIDRKCPFTGLVSIRGRILQGKIKSAKMQRTVIVRRDYLHYVRKYQRFEKRHTNIPAHLPPCFRVKAGDTVTIGQCRPLSKTVRFCVIRLDKSGSGARRKGFAGF